MPPERERVPTAVGLILGVCLQVTVCAGDFADAIVEYQPAPGQFINNTNFNDPQRVLGPPTGGGTINPDLSSVVSLGGFGGSITVSFAQTVLDDPRNPLGLDAIVFSNAFWPVGDPAQRFLEPAVIEISRDTNANGIADDAWYVIPGSHLPGQPLEALTTQDWDDDPGTSTPPATLAWYPDAALYPGVGSMYSTVGYELPLGLPEPSDVFEVVWGYGDMSPTLLLGDRSGATGSAADNSLSDGEDLPSILPACFYTVPDDPMTIGVDPYSGGGDAFDIAWAVVPATGLPAGLDGFDFLRLRTGQHGINGPLGEISAEIDAIADVRVPADLNSDNHVSGVDLLLLLGVWGSGDPCADLNRDSIVNGVDLLLLLGSWDPELEEQKSKLVRRSLDAGVFLP